MFSLNSKATASRYATSTVTPRRFLQFTVRRPAADLAMRQKSYPLPASDDDSATWYDYAVSDTDISPYAIGGCRKITPDRFVIVTFTDLIGPTSDAGVASKVYSLQSIAGPGPRK
jgi:hypothetical protein